MSEINNDLRSNSDKNHHLYNLMTHGHQERINYIIINKLIYQQGLGTPP